MALRIATHQHRPRRQHHRRRLQRMRSLWPDPIPDSCEESDSGTTRASTPSRDQRSSLDMQRAATPPAPVPEPTSQQTLSAEALSRIQAAGAEFLRCFPTGWHTIPTSGEDLLCGWYAVISSMHAQCPDLPYPTLEELDMVFREQSAEHAEIYGMDNINNFSVDQVAAVLYSWGVERGLNLRLGYLEQGNYPLLVSHPNEDDDIRVVWVHNNGHWDTGLGHFSGIRRWSLEMREEELRQEALKMERSAANGQTEGPREAEQTQGVCETDASTNMEDNRSGETRIGDETCEGLSKVETVDWREDEGYLAGDEGIFDMDEAV